MILKIFICIITIIDIIIIIREIIKHNRIKNGYCPYCKHKYRIYYKDIRHEIYSTKIIYNCDYCNWKKEIYR